MTWQPSQLTRAQMEERRRAAAQVLRAGKLSQAEIARRLGVGQSSVSEWKQTLQAKGLRGLKARKASGRPSRLSAPQKKALRKLLRRGARAAGFPTERWTLRRIQQLIAREFHVQYHAHYLNRLLRSLGWSVQQPIAHAIERDDELIVAWLAHDWSRIKKSSAAWARNHTG